MKQDGIFPIRDITLCSFSIATFLGYVLFFNLFALAFIVLYRRPEGNSSNSLRLHTHGLLAKRLMHMAHKSGNTSGVSKSSSDLLNYTGFPEDICFAFFNVPHGNKDAMMPNPPHERRKPCMYNCDDERLSGSTKRWIFKSMRNI